MRRKNHAKTWRSELIGKIQRVEMDLTFSKNGRQESVAGAQQGEGTERKGCRSARWTVSNTRWPWVGGSQEGVLLISKYDGRFSQTYFAGLSEHEFQGSGPSP